MMTARELSRRTGVSVRVLHRDDAIRLLPLTEKSGAGYHLYDATALERMQQILFFREFDMPRQTIRAVLDDQTLTRRHILLMQREMPAAKAERTTRLITGLDEILKRENRMDFEVFRKRIGKGSGKQPATVSRISCGRALYAARVRRGHAGGLPAACAGLWR